MNETFKQLTFNNKTFTFGKDIPPEIILVQEIYKSWGLRSKDYAPLLKLVKEKGSLYGREIFNQVHKMNIPHRLNYFLAIVSRQEII